MNRVPDALERGVDGVDRQLPAVNRDLDLVDLLIAGAVAAGVVLWAFLWAEPYPHPDLWSFLAKFGHRVSLGTLSVLGKLTLGVFAGLVYLVFRGAWIRFSDPEDDQPDKFFFARFCPLCGAVVFALFPQVWRLSQFLSPDAGLLMAEVFGLLLWQRGCGARNLHLVTVSYVLLAFVSGCRPLGLVGLAYVVACDVVRRWQNEQVLDLEAEKHEAERLRTSELLRTLIGGLLGFGVAVNVLATDIDAGMTFGGVVAVVVAWWRAWSADFGGMIHSSAALVVVVGVGFTAAAIAIGRRLRANGERSYFMVAVLALVLAFAAIAAVMRSIDLEERMRLGQIRDYIGEVLADSEGATWLFTDGRFDDALRFEARRSGKSVCVLNALMPPARTEAEWLKTLAPEPGDVELFRAGGAEVFKAWARERPDRLAAAAWQVGTAIFRRFNKDGQRTHGTVMRSMRDKAAAEGAKTADSRFERMSQDVLRIAERPTEPWMIFGSVDEAVEQKFDAIVWRAARMAGERADAATKAGEKAVASAERKTMQDLDTLNKTLREQRHILERLLPSTSIVLTSKEALEVALKRADFALAQRYAREVLISSPDDARAHFALGMESLETGEHFKASQHFELVLKTQPNEPATLNNLSLAYLKLGKAELAKATAEKALKINPNSAEVKKNLEAIKKKLLEEAKQAN